MSGVVRDLIAMRWLTRYAVSVASFAHNAWLPKAMSADQTERLDDARSLVYGNASHANDDVNNVILQISLSRMPQRS